MNYIVMNLFLMRVNPLNNRLGNTWNHMAGEMNLLINNTGETGFIAYHHTKAE